MMICCDQCGDWFHINCIGVTDADAATMDENDTPLPLRQVQTTRYDQRTLKQMIICHHLFRCVTEL